MKEIKGYEGKYYTDVNGGIYRWVIRKKIFKKLKPMRLSGYVAVDLGLNGNIKRHLVHRIVANTFIDNPDNNPQVNHINGDKLDNRVENLEWVTRSENQKHAFSLGLATAKGIKNSQCKLTEKSVLEIRKDDRANKLIAKEYLVSVTTIYDIKMFRSWNHI